MARRHIISEDVRLSMISPVMPRIPGLHRVALADHC